MLNRSLAPAFSKFFSFELPYPEVVKLQGDIDFVFLPQLQQEVFKLEVVFNAGKWFEPKPGLAHFTSILLDKGTSSKSSKEIAVLLDYYGAQVEISSGYDFVSVSCYGMRKYFQETISLFEEILIGPVFPERELELQKEIFLQNLAINEKKNSFVASKLIRQNIFGANHPYGGSVEKNNVAELASHELKGYFKTYFSPFEIYWIGNLDSQQTQWLTDRLSSMANGKSVDEKNFPIIAGDPLQRIAKPDSVQSSIRLGMRTIDRGHNDYFSLLLLNHILGGYFGSRLMKNIREEKGLTYGIYSSLNPFKNDSMFSIGADVNKDNLELTVNEIKKELEALSLHPIAQDELDIARNHLLGSLQLEVANPFSTFSKIKSIRLNKLGNDYYHNLFSEIQLFTPGSLQAIAQKYFNASELMEVSVG